MKAISSLTGVFVLTFALVACDGGESEPPPPPPEATFEELDNPTDHIFEPRAVNRDGSVVLGSKVVSPIEPVRWVLDESIGAMGPREPMGVPVDSDGATGSDLSADASTMVGFSFSRDSGSLEGKEALRWRGGSVTPLGTIPGGSLPSRALGVSANGSVVVGSGENASNDREAFRMVGSVIVGLGFLSGDSRSEARGVSADGSVVVGTSGFSSTEEAFRWEDGDMTGLAPLHDGSSGSRALAVSADGNVIVGQATDSLSRRQAVRWKNGSIQGLGFVATGVEDEFSQAEDVSDDGAIVVGYSRVDEDDSGTNEAFIWTEESGMRNLQFVLEQEFGLDLTGWRLGIANNISDDGTVIVGVGRNPNGNFAAWRAFLGSPVGSGQ